MNLVDLSSHTVDLDALPESPKVLDVGSRNFGFSAAVLLHRPFAAVIAMDPDPLIDINKAPARISFLRTALAGDDRKTAKYASFSTGEGNFICEAAPGYAREFTVPCMSIGSLKASHWDLVKLDCEGSEFGILENWPGPIADQISVEFHNYTDHARWNDAYFAKLFAGPLKDYEVIQHELTPVGPGPSFGHWDTLLKLRSR